MIYGLILHSACDKCILIEITFFFRRSENMADILNSSNGVMRDGSLAADAERS